jgi:hypothetical protein
VCECTLHTKDKINKIKEMYPKQLCLEFTGVEGKEKGGERVVAGRGEA